MSLPVTVHPLALPAFDIWAGIAAGGTSGAARAVKAEGRLHVFAGFCWLAEARLQFPVLIETDIPAAEIEAAAWSEVECVLLPLLTKPADLVRIARVLAARAPEPVLDRLGLPANRDIRTISRRLRVSALLREDTRPEPSVFERAKAKFEESRQP